MAARRRARARKSTPAAKARKKAAKAIATLRRGVGSYSARLYRAAGGCKVSISRGGRHVKSFLRKSVSDARAYLSANGFDPKPKPLAKTAVSVSGKDSKGRIETWVRGRHSCVLWYGLTYISSVPGWNTRQSHAATIRHPSLAAARRFLENGGWKINAITPMTARGGIMRRVSGNLYRYMPMGGA